MNPSETESIAPAEPELQTLPEPSAWPVWVIGGLGFLATLVAAAFAVLAIALRGYGDGAPGPEPGFFGLLAIWSPAVYFGLLTASCLSGVSEARAARFLLIARIVLAVFVIIIVFSFGGREPPARLSGLFLLILAGIAAIGEGSWRYLRHRKRWSEL